MICGVGLGMYVTEIKEKTTFERINGGNLHF